jgi:hypothetical protein
MKFPLGCFLRRFFFTAFFGVGFPLILQAVDHQQPPLNATGAPVLDKTGQHINYNRKTLALQGRVTDTKPAGVTAAVSSGVKGPLGFVPSSPSQQRPFWQYAIFGSGIGVSNIVIGPTPAGGVAPEILIGGNSTNNFGGDDFWQSIRRNSSTGNYDQVFVSPTYSALIVRIGIANVVGDSNPEIVVTLADGRIYLYDFATKAELGYVNIGINGLTASALADLNGDGLAEFIVTTANDLFVFNSAGNLLWQVLGAGGVDVVVGQMDNDPALEIATTSGKVVDAGTHAVQWTRNTGFGVHLALAPFPGENYQQLIEAESWQFVYSYDIARQLPRWSINTPQDIGAIQVADVDGDGIPEIIIGDGQWGNVHVHDLVTQAQKWAVNNPQHGVTNIAVGDVDGDHVADLLWGAGWTSTGPDYLYIANTTGTHSIKWQSIDLQGPFIGPAIGDLDGDGQQELVVCSRSSNSGYDSGRILVFDLATLALRGTSAPVVNNLAWSGVNGSAYLYDGAIEIYDFNASNTFTRNWTNATRPSGSPFNFIEVADLDGNGTRKIIGGNTVASTGSPGVYVYVYDYPSGTNSWRSVNLASSFNGVTGLVVDDLDGNGSKEIAALVSTGDLYTFDGPTRQLRNLFQSTGYSLLSNKASPAGLIGGDNNGVGHFLQYSNNTYTEILTRQLSSGVANGINVLSDESLWVGSGNTLSLFLPSPFYNSFAWQSPPAAAGFGRFVVTDIRNGQNRVFSSSGNAVVGLTYTPALTLAGAASRKQHGSAGPFDIDLPLTGVGVECRGGDGNYTLVFTFTNKLVSGNASVVSGTGAVSGPPAIVNNTMTVNLGGVANQQKITVTLSAVTDSFSQVLPDTSIVMGILPGDTTGNGVVNSSDISQAQSESGHAVDSTNFREDVTLNGLINSSDIGFIQSKSGTGLP